MASMWLIKLKLPLSLIVIQVTFLTLFAFFVDYGSEAKPGLYGDSENNISNGSPKAASTLHDYYPMFQDVHVMIFVGFGFLMMFLRRYGFSSVGLNLLLAAITIQWSTLVGGFIHHRGDKFTVSVVSMITSDFAAAAVLITFGALLGKTSPLQLVVVAMIEVFVYSANEYIGVVLLQVSDIGGSMFIHAFGAYFGLAVSRVLYNPEVEKSTKEGSIYHSDMFALVGTVFLWMFWPSFNSALAVEDAQHRAVLNTYLALAACCVFTFAASSLVGENGKFDMVHIQNATLAGGVAIGTSADMIILPYGALIIGSVAGFMSVIGYKYVTPFLKCKLKIHDTCGVHNLHGLPAILAGVTGAIAASMADLHTYGYTLYRQFPAMAPNASSPEWPDLEGHVEFKPGKGLIYWEVNFPFPLWNRDYVYGRECRVMEKNGQKVWVILAKSMTSPSIPEKSGVIRVDDYLQSVALWSDGKSGTKVFMKYYDNPKGNIPKWLINWGAKTGVPQFLTVMETACKGYPHYLESKKPPT